MGMFSASSVGAKKFCCNDMLRCTILPLRLLPLTLQNLYMTNPNNFSHNSRQYNSLFSFTVLGYMGGIVHLPHLHAFAVNGRAYHQVYPANAKGYPTIWFVYDADRCVHIWRIGEENPTYINILDENYDALQYLLFFPRGEIASVAVHIGENDEINKIKNYINARYLSAMEAVWRIFKYKITLQLLSVTCLPVHLPEEQTIL
ncbi:25492_t:CDS:2 [Gigaspora rosea]|nr:25492_t:CDS:2 [Gigaspora rosea]